MIRLNAVSVVCLGAWLAQAIAAPASKGPVRGEASGIVGKWELTKSADEGVPLGAIVEFTKDNKVTITIDFDGKKLELAGKYKLDGDQLTVSITPPDGGKEETDTDTVKTLTDEKIVLVDKKGKETELTRKK